jgi:hypothetical protein
MDLKITEEDSKEILLQKAKDQLAEIRKGALDMRAALRTDSDYQIKFVIETINLIHNFMFNEAPTMALILAHPLMKKD